MDKFENKNKRHSIFVWVSFILKIIYHTKSPTSIALNKETAIPLTRSFQTFFPMTDDFSPPNNEL